jgi:hypothetical protein
MNKLKRHHLFWMVSVFFLILTVFYVVVNESQTSNIYNSDDYFTISDTAATKVFAVINLIVGFIYWLFFYFKISLNPILSKVHTLITTGSVFVYVIGKFGIESSLKGNFPFFENPPDLNLFILIMVLLVLAIQIIFIINILLSVAKHTQSKTGKRE